MRKTTQTLFVVGVFALLGGCYKLPAPTFSNDSLPPDPWEYPTKDGAKATLGKHRSTSCPGDPELTDPQPSSQPTS